MTAFLLAAVGSGKPLEGFRAPLVAAFVALVVTIGFTPFVRRFAIKRGAVDDPTVDSRRVHTEPIPRWGGLAIYGGILVSLLAVLPMAYRSAAFPPYLVAMLVIGFGLTLFGALDDVKPLSAGKQAAVLLAAGLAVQFFFDNHTGRVQIGSIVVPIWGHLIVFGPWSYVITAIYVFVVAKTMDTIDGLDGLASGIAAISATTLMIVAVYSGQPRVAIIAATITGAALGFLRHNYNPARIFMGTGGAQTLGFLLASLSVVGAMKTAAAFAIIVPVLAFGVPIFDAAFVVVRRLASGVPITQADKRHLHHTLLGKGLSQRQAVMVMYGLAAMLCFVLVLTVLKQHG